MNTPTIMYSIIIIVYSEQSPATLNYTTSHNCEFT